MADSVDDIGGAFERAAERTARRGRARRLLGYEARGTEQVPIYAEQEMPPTGTNLARLGDLIARGYAAKQEQSIPDVIMAGAGGASAASAKLAALLMAGDVLSPTEAKGGVVDKLVKAASKAPKIAEKATRQDVTGEASGMLPTLARMGEGAAFRAPDLPRPSVLVPQRDILRVPGVIASPTVMPSAFERSLFDYSKLHEVPNVPQFNLPRYDPPRGVPPHIAAIDNPENVARINAAVERGIKRGGLAWYNTMPLKEGWIGEVGQQAGIPRYERWMHLEGATSPRTAVPMNIGQGSYYQMLAEQGLPLPQPVLAINPKTGKPNWTLLEGELPLSSDPKGLSPLPYGSLAMATNAMNARMVLAEGGWPASVLFDKPKPPSFTQNLLGNYQPVAVDIHHTGLLGIRDPKTGKLLQDPGKTGYKFSEELTQREARNMGIEPAQYQSSGWIEQATKGKPNAEYDKPYLRLVEDRVKDAAREYGWTPEATLRMFYRGQIPIAMGGLGAPGVIDAMRQDQTQAQ